MTKQTQCAKCQSFKIQTDSGMAIATGIAMILISPWVLFFLMWIIGVTAVWIAGIVGVIGMLSLLSGIFVKELKHSYQCKSCGYRANN